MRTYIVKNKHGCLMDWAAFSSCETAYDEIIDHVLDEMSAEGIDPAVLFEGYNTDLTSLFEQYCSEYTVIGV